MNCPHQKKVYPISGNKKIKKTNISQNSSVVKSVK